MPRTFDTVLTCLHGIRYPIVQGGMMWVGRADIASAVSNAGVVPKNTVPDEAAVIERWPGGATFEDIAHLVAGARGRAALECA